MKFTRFNYPSYGFSGPQVARLTCHSLCPSMLKSGGARWCFSADQGLKRESASLNSSFSFVIFLVRESNSAKKNFIKDAVSGKFAS